MVADAARGSGGGDASPSHCQPSTRPEINDDQCRLRLSAVVAHTGRHGARS